MPLENLTPVTRMESILNGDDIDPVTREEYFVKNAVSSGGASGGASQCLIADVTTSGFSAKTNTTTAVRNILTAMRADYAAGHTVDEISKRLFVHSILFGVAQGQQLGGNNLVTVQARNIVKLNFNGTQTLCKWNRQYNFNMTQTTIAFTSGEVRISSVNNSSFDLYAEDCSDFTNSATTQDGVQFIYYPMEV